jgi:CRP-like cAMP-binding protein
MEQATGKRELFLNLHKALKAGNLDAAATAYETLMKTLYGGVDSDFLKHLGDRSVLGILKDVELITARPGEAVVREGEPGDSMYIIVSGVVTITSKPPKTKGPVLPLPPVLINHMIMKLLSGNKVLVNEVSTGDYFGEMSILTGKPRTATVTAKTNAELLKISAAVFWKVLGEKPELHSMMKDLYIERIDNMMNSLKHANDSLNSCVCETIVEKAMHHGRKSAGPAGMELPPSTVKFSNSNRFFGGRMDRDAINAIVELQNKGMSKAAARAFFSAFFSHVPYFASLLVKDAVQSVYSTVKDVAESVSPRMRGRLPEFHFADEDFHQETRAEVKIDTEEAFKSFFDDLIERGQYPIEPRRLKEDEVIVKYGDDSDGIFVIKEGYVKVYRFTQETGERQEDLRISAPSHFGEFAFLLRQQRNATVTAGRDTVVYELTRSLLDEVIASTPQVMDYLRGAYLVRIKELMAYVNALRDEAAGIPPPPAAAIRK